MVEGSFRSVDPLAYYVNNVEDFDGDIVGAFLRKDTAEIKRLASRGNKDAYDVFICVSKNWHGFILCVPANAVDPMFEDMITDVIQSPFDVPDLIICSTFELCYEDEKMRTYKILKGSSLFKDIKEKIKRSFFVAHFEGVSPSGLQVAAIRSAPHRYAVLLNDCVEFSKEFCIQLLHFSSNGKEIEGKVKEGIKAATASGFSAEHLSRNVRSSAWFGNVFLNGPELSQVFSRRNQSLTVCFLFLLFLVYPVIVVIVINSFVK